MRKHAKGARDIADDVPGDRADDRARQLPLFDRGIAQTFREKSLWVSLVATLAIYAYYFLRVLQLGDGNPGRVAGLFVGTVIAMIVVQVVISAALAIHRKPERPDERDRQFSLVASRISYYVLMTGVWAALTVGALQLGTFWMIHAGLAAIVLGEVTRCGVQVYLYRAG